MRRRRAGRAREGTERAREGAGRGREGAGGPGRKLVVWISEPGLCTASMPWRRRFEWNIIQNHHPVWRTVS